MTQTLEQVRKVELQPGIWIEMPEPRTAEGTLPATMPWTARERAAMSWPAPTLPSQWAVDHVILEKGALPGPWKNENAPYLKGMMDIAVKRGVEKMVWKKGVQVGASMATRILLGYWAHHDPAEMGLSLPNREKGREIVENEILPFFRSFARDKQLKGLLSKSVHDMKKGQVKLANNFLMHLMWSGSPASTASNPMKRAIGDEVNKNAAWAGIDVDPISSIEYRLRTFAGRLLLLLSSPTTSSGEISVHFESCTIKLYYLVPCPHCETQQRLLFGEGGDYGVKWSELVRALAKQGLREAAAAVVLQPGQCWYQCCQCHGRIDEKQKRAMVRAGKWGTVGKDLMTSDVESGEKLAAGEGAAAMERILDAEAVPAFPAGTSIGMHISSLYTCWESWTLAHVAREFLRANTPAKVFAFRTSTLGEHWESTAEAVTIETIDVRVKEAELEEGILPRWTARLIAVADTQKDHFWLVIRAWGPGMRSQRVWHGRVASFEELEQWCFRHPWANEDARLPAWTCDGVYIDSGGTRKYDEEENNDAPLPSRVMDVYAWCLKNAGMAHAIKGDARPEEGVFIRRGKGMYVVEGEKRPVPLQLLDTHHFHDELANLMLRREIPGIDRVNVETGEVPPGSSLGAWTWGLNKRHDPEYHHHLTNMHKAMVPVSRGSRGKTLELRWKPLREGVRVDYRACEAYQVAAAYMKGVNSLPDMPTYMAGLEAEIARRREPAPEYKRLIETPDGRPFLASQRET